MNIHHLLNKISTATTDALTHIVGYDTTAKKWKKITWANFVTAVSLTATDSRVTTKVKTADQTVTASTTLVNDTHLTFTVPVSTTYRVTGILDVSTPALADMDILLSMPAGATFQGTAIGKDEIASAWPWDGTEHKLETNAGVTHIDGILTIGATAGTVVLQFAQTASDAGNTTLKTGSHLILTKISA